MPYWHVLGGVAVGFRLAEEVEGWSEAITCGHTGNGVN
jgi:hypothetical protein